MPRTSTSRHAPALLIRTPWITRTGVGAWNRFARLPVQDRVGALRWPLPSSTTAASDGAAGRRRARPTVGGWPDVIRQRAVQAFVSAILLPTIRGARVTTGGACRASPMLKPPDDRRGSGARRASDSLEPRAPGLEPRRREEGGAPRARSEEYEPETRVPAPDPVGSDRRRSAAWQLSWRDIGARAVRGSRRGYHRRPRSSRNRTKITTVSSAATRRHVRPSSCRRFNHPLSRRAPTGTGPGPV